MRVRRAMIPAYLLALGGCGGEVGPRPQWVVSIGTDAPVPQLGDMLLVEVVDAAGHTIPKGRRIFGVDDARSWPISFGIQATEGADEKRGVRAVLYRSVIVGPEGFPESDALMETAGWLPPASADTTVGLRLSSVCFGNVEAHSGSTFPTRVCNSDSAELVDVAELEAPASPLPEMDSWPHARTLECNGVVPDGMLCVPGGLFIRGAPLNALDNQDFATTPERLAVIQPFAVDRFEVTVGVIRSLLIAGKVNEAPLLHVDDLKLEVAACTYRGVDDAAFDEYPANCVSYELAEQACAALGKRLPTEAEWEYVAGNRSLETPYPWGWTEDRCDHAVVGVGRPGSAVFTDLSAEYVNCRDGASWGARPGGHPCDATLVGDGEVSCDTSLPPPANAVMNLGGNVSEWVRGVFAAYTDACFGAGVPLLDPTCDTTSNVYAYAREIRGGSWATWVPANTTRDAAETGAAHKQVGFRCALDMKPEERK